MPVTSLNNYGFAFNDFEFGGGNSVYQIMTVDGLEDLPVIRNQDDNRGYQDGMWTGRDFLSGRTISMTITIRGDANNSAQVNFARLQAYLQPQTSGTSPLQFQLPGRALQRVNARVRRRASQINTSYSSGLITANYEFFCPEPLIYDDTLNQVEIFGTQNITGRTYNRIYNMLFGGGGQGLQLCFNAGWTETYPVFTIRGPGTNPQVTDVISGKVLSVVYPLQAADVLILDTNYRTLTLNGVNRRSLLTNNSTWFAMPPGNNYFQYNVALGATTGTSCVVSWRSAYV